MGLELMYMPQDEGSAISLHVIQMGIEKLNIKHNTIEYSGEHQVVLMNGDTEAGMLRCGLFDGTDKVAFITFEFWPIKTECENIVKLVDEFLKSNGMIDADGE